MPRKNNFSVSIMNLLTLLKDLLTNEEFLTKLIIVLFAAQALRALWPINLLSQRWPIFLYWFGATILNIGVLVMSRKF